jgi:hypothetical protein
MAQGRNYTSLGYADKTDLENFLLLSIDSSFDTQVVDWLSVAEKQVNNYLGYTTASGIFAESIVAEKAKGKVNGEGDLVIFPNKIPIISVSGIDLVKGTSSVTLSLTDSAGTPRYDIPMENDRIYYPNQEFSLTGTSTIGSFFNIKFSTFFTKLNYIAGYTEVPADIRQATVNLVADIVMRHSNKEALQSMTQGRISKSWMSREGASDFYLDAITLLSPYRIVSQWLS